MKETRISVIEKLYALVRKLGIAVYLLLFAVAVILFFMRYWVSDPIFGDGLIGLSTNLISVALFFFLVNVILGYDPDSIQREELKSRIEQLFQLQSKKGIGDIYPSASTIYTSGINYLHSDTWKCVRVYAPVGLWRTDEDKKNWLTELASYAKQKKVDTVYAVFGLPPVIRDGKSVTDKKLQSELKYVFDVLSAFSGIENVYVNYYPPTYASVGFGSIIFQRKDNSGQIIIGLASHRQADIVDFAFSIEDEQIYWASIDWFDGRIFQRATRAFVLQEDGIALSEKWRHIVDTWYGPEFIDCSNKPLVSSLINEPPSGDDEH